MSSTANTTNSTESPFASICTKHALLKISLDTAPGGSSVHLPPMTDQPDPERDQQVVRMYSFWNDFLFSQQGSPGDQKLAAELEERRGQLDSLGKEIADLKAEFYNDSEKSLGEVAMTMLGLTKSLQRILKLSEEANRFVEQANKEAVGALKEEMRKW